MNFREERKSTVPLIVCRVCNQKFYADMEKEHSKFCVEKINKLSKIPQLDK
jgi:hypothetical protein